MKKINRWLIFLLCVPTVAFAQQNSLLQKYRSMALDYNHDLKAADKNIAASIELEKAAQKDLRPKLSGEANFQYTGNPLQLNIDLPSMQTPLAFEGRNMKYGASLSLLQPVYPKEGNESGKRVGGYWKVSVWLNISKVWQYIRQIISVPQYPIRQICNIGTLLRVQK